LGIAHLYVGLSVGLPALSAIPDIFSFECLSQRQRNGHYLRKLRNLVASAASVMLSASCTSVMGLYTVMDPETIRVLVLTNLQSLYDYLSPAPVVSSPRRQQQQPVNIVMSPCRRRHQRQLQHLRLGLRIPFYLDERSSTFSSSKTSLRQTIRRTSQALYQCSVQPSRM